MLSSPLLLVNSKVSFSQSFGEFAELNKFLIAIYGQNTNFYSYPSALQTILVTLFIDWKSTAAEYAPRF